MTVDILWAGGILICGLRGKGKYYSEPVIITTENRRIRFLGYNWEGKINYPDRRILSSIRMTARSTTLGTEVHLIRAMPIR